MALRGMLQRALMLALPLLCRGGVRARRLGALGHQTMLVSLATPTNITRQTMSVGVVCGGAVVFAERLVTWLIHIDKARERLGERDLP